MVPETSYIWEELYLLMNFPVRFEFCPLACLKIAWLLSLILCALSTLPVRMFSLISLNYWPSTSNIYYLEENKRNQIQSIWKPLSVRAYGVDRKIKLETSWPSSHWCILKAILWIYISGLGGKKNTWPQLNFLQTA